MADHSPALSLSQLIALIIFSLIVLTGQAAGASVSFNQSPISVMPGDVTTVDLILDTAPAGISGFAIRISMEDPSIGEITAVTLPGWAELSDIAGVPGPEVRIIAVDLQEMVDKGASGILLATLSVKGLSPGTTEILLMDPKFDDDEDGRIVLTLSNTSFTVTTEVSTIPPTTNATATITTTTTATATTSSSVLTGGSGGAGSGGGGSGGGSYSPGTTPIPGIPGNETNVTITSEQTGIETAEAPVSATTPAAPFTTLPETAPPVTGSQGIPFLTVPGILVLIGAMVLLGRKKR
jgi:uncharacterized membrane protein YgcG